jgi:hypothetical protein
MILCPGANYMRVIYPEPWMPPHAVPVTLTAAERKTLNKRARGAKTPHRDRLRALIVLAAARGRASARIAADLGTAVDTVRKWWDLTTIAGALAGLRLADFTLTARRWVAILDKHDLPVPHRPLGLGIAMIGSELPEGLDPRLVAAIEEVRRDAAAGASALRDQFLRQVGVDRLESLVY